jgi:hypothetical protein
MAFFGYCSQYLTLLIVISQQIHYAELEKIISPNTGTLYISLSNLYFFLPFLHICINLIE